MRTSFELNLGVRSYDRKTNQKVRIVLAQDYRQITRRRPIELLYEQTGERIVSSTSHLWVELKLCMQLDIYTFSKTSHRW